MTDEEDNKAWVENGRLYSPLDNEALSRYFDKRVTLEPETRTKFEDAFKQALDEGWRPKHAVKRAMAAIGEPV